MTAIVGFAGAGYGLLAVDRNIVARHSDGKETILSSNGGKLHTGPDGFFAGAGKAELLQNVASRVRESTDPRHVARAMRAERKSRYVRRREFPETSFGVLLRRGAQGPEVFVLRPEEGYRPELVPPGRPLVTGPEAREMRPLIGAFRLLFAPTPGPESLARNLDLLHLYFWLRHRLNPVISADFDLAVLTGAVAEMSTRPNEFEKDPEHAMQIAEYLSELGNAFGALAIMVKGAIEHE
ncbi:MAG TPA: hypothetical protein VMV18_13955 [bacterium]|nr:hypothetical protein [bacterium]